MTHYQMNGRPCKTLAWHSPLEVYGQWLTRLQVLPDAVHKLPVLHLDLRPPYIEGNGGYDNVSGGFGTDEIHGGDGDDTYIWGCGQGNDNINDTLANSRNTVVLRGLNPQDVQVGLINVDEYTSVRLMIASTGEALIFHNGGDQGWYDSRNASVHSVFADCTQWDLNEAVRQSLAMPAKGNDVLIGTNFDDYTYCLAGSAGADVIVGRGGADVIEGGTGFDSCTADRQDFILDEDGQGSVTLAGEKLGLATRKKGETICKDDAGKKPSLSGSTLTVNGGLKITDFTSSDLGIVLQEKDGDGVKTTALSQTRKGTSFDHANDSFAEQTGWVGQGDGLLVRDLNNNGKINSGTELFDSETLLTNGQNQGQKANGFEAMRQMDINGNEKIDAGDTGNNKYYQFRSYLRTYISTETPIRYLKKTSCYASAKYTRRRKITPNSIAACAGIHWTSAQVEGESWPRKSQNHTHLQSEACS
jgi:Ca2+-binding RTX toxin-like protein